MDEKNFKKKNDFLINSMIYWIKITIKKYLYNYLNLKNNQKIDFFIHVFFENKTCLFLWETFF